MNDQPICGILLLDKPINMTSNAALQVVKRLYGVKKAGHTGSLDPLATGMLPICLGEATKFSRFLLDADKRYHVTAKLGITTDTGDAEGAVIAKQCVNVSKQQLQSVLQRFNGNIEQIPPMYSALKHQGRPLYQYAREGISIERKSRKIIIYQLQLIHFQEDVFSLAVHCSKGTYIRSLIEDIGAALGCGAHVSALRRLSVSSFNEDKMLRLDELNEDSTLLPLNDALQMFPAVHISKNYVDKVFQGQSIIIDSLPFQGWVRLLADNDGFIGMGEVLEEGCITPRRLLTKELVTSLSLV